MNNGTEVHQSFTYLGVDDHNITRGRVYGVLTDDELSFDVLTPTDLSKREDGDVWEETKCSSTACTINFHVVQFLHNTLDSVASFMDTSNTTLEYISSTTKDYSKSDACGSGVLDLAAFNGEDWNVAVAVYSNALDCDTTASAEQINCAMSQAIIEEENHKMMAYCVRLDHSGTWNADIRIQRHWDHPYPSIWNMPCDRLNDDIPVNNYCIA